MYNRAAHGNAPSGFQDVASVRSIEGVPATASRNPIILSGCTRLERLRYAAEQAILDWRDSPHQVRPTALLAVRDKQIQISRAKYRNAQLAYELSARTWVDNWEPPTAA
jgi:hypothetical protein